MDVRHETLVLVPGLVCDARIWEPQVAALSESLDVLVSEVVDGTSIPQMAESLLDAAPPTFALAGHSMGGYVAWEVLRRAPERVTALGLLSTSARADPPERVAARLDLVDTAERDGYAAAFDVLWPAVVAPSRVGDRALRDRFWEMSAQHGAGVFGRQQHAMLARPDSRADMARVAVPTLVLCGRQDAITPLDGNVEMAEGVPGADLVVLGDCGHLPTWERPDDVTAALRRWLGR